MAKTLTCAYVIALHYILYTRCTDICDISFSNYDTILYQNSSLLYKPDTTTLLVSKTESPKTANFTVGKSKAYGMLHTLKIYSEWANREEEIVKVLEQRLDLLDTEATFIKNYLDDYEESSGQAIKHARVPTNTPEERGQIIGKSAVLGHRMTYRYTAVLAPLRTLLMSNDYLENWSNLNKTLELDNLTSPWVNRRDMFMSMNSLLHLEDVNHFFPIELLHGKTIDTSEGGKLNPDHCLEMAIFTLYRGHYFKSVEWLELIPQILESEIFSTNGISRDLVGSITQLVKQQHNRILKYVVAGHNKKYEDMSGVFFYPLTPNDKPEERLTIQRYELLYGRDNPVLNDDIKFSLLCMGQSIQSPEVVKRLYCYYEKRQHPYLYINPVKTEVLLDEPPVLQFYEVIGDKMIEKIKNLEFIKRLRLSHLISEKTAEEITVFRTSAGTKIRKNEMPKSVYKFAEILTGLKVFNNSEDTQYVEYTYGRYYTFHDDAYGSNPEARKLYLEATGDRMATMLYYLELADIGGATAFPNHRITARPERGSAVLWYNLYRNGSYRTDMNHGACPIIHGHKIIMNHWIFYRGDWDHRKCSLNQVE